MLNLTLPDGIGRNTGICAVYHWRKERKNAVKPLLWFSPSHLETRRQLNWPHSIFIVARWFFFQHRQLLFSSWKLISIMVQRCIRRFPNPSREFCIVVLMYKNSKANIFFFCLDWMERVIKQSKTARGKCFSLEGWLVSTISSALHPLFVKVHKVDSHWSCVTSWISLPQQINTQYGSQGVFRLSLLGTRHWEPGGLWRVSFRASSTQVVQQLSCEGWRFRPSQSKWQGAEQDTEC